MRISAKVSFKDYYDLNPPIKNNAGDIWSGLPTYGLLPGEKTDGIVITPSCDILNRKVETVTYLPILPIPTYLTSLAFVPLWSRELKRQSEAAGLEVQITVDSFFPPDPIQQAYLAKTISGAMATERLSDKIKTSLERCRAALILLQACYQSNVDINIMQLVKTALGEKEYSTTIKRIVTNSYSLDVHFMPADQQPADWSAVPRHSVALFRYPMTAPVEILEVAQDLNMADWQAEIVRIRRVLPGVGAFAVEQPIKRATLKPRFFSDLQTRYVAMHVRLGSPDFSKETVDEFVTQIGQGR